jgi:hypothetical protein
MNAKQIEEFSDNIELSDKEENSDPILSNKIEESVTENGSTETLNKNHSEATIGIQTHKREESNTMVLEIQDKSLRNPNISDLEAQNLNFGNPNRENLGDPNEEGLGLIAPKDEIREPKYEPDLGAIEHEENDLGTQKTISTEAHRKYEKARSTKSVHIRADASIVNRAKVFIVDNAEEISTMRELFEVAVVKLMNEFGHPNTANLGTNAPHEDRRLKILFKSKPFIINLYLTYNSVFNELASVGGKKWSARWTPRDDEAAARYNDLPSAIVELGILQTQVQKGFGTSRIQTFKYYTDEIEKVLASGVSDDMLQNILIYHRKLWKNETGREIDLSSLDNEGKQ